MELSQVHDEETAAHTGAACSQNITVFCRLKPRSASEEKFSPFAVDDEKTICVNQPAASSSPQEQRHKTSPTKTPLVFTFDHVYDESSSQEVIFEGVGKPLVETVCNGVNATVLAYGTTASGKTYTMLGARTAFASEKTYTNSGTRTTPSSTYQDMPDDVPWIQQVGACRDLPDENRHWGCNDGGVPSNPYGENVGAVHLNDGLLPRMIFYLFDCLERKQKLIDKKLVKAAAMEVYNDSIVDLATRRTGLKVHKPKFGQVSIVGLHEEVLPGPKAAIAFLERVVDGRKTASTCVNAESSRSHFVFWLILQGTASLTGTSTTTRLSVVDLAGSERLVKTNTCGSTQVEGAMINKSLTCLGKVINCLAALSEAQKGRASGSSGGDREAPCSIQQYRVARFIPYRDSKLTRVLQDSLGGNSHTYIMLTCSQDVTHLAENIPTLRFGQRARNVKSSAKVNMVDDNRKDAMQRDICRYQNYIRALTSWGETAIVKLSGCTRSARAKHCGLQSIPVLCKTAVSSRNVGCKRISTLTPCSTEEFNEEGRQVEVVDELLSVFPAPPKALQLDFTKDDLAMNIRYRLQRELISSTGGVESQRSYLETEPAPTASTVASFAYHEAGEYQIHSLNAHLMYAGSTTDRESPARRSMTAMTAKNQCDAVVTTVKESVKCCPSERRQTGDSSNGHSRHAPTAITAPLCDLRPADMTDCQACSSTPQAAEETREACESSDSRSCERLPQPDDSAGPGRLRLGFCRRERIEDRIAFSELLTNRSSSHVETQRSGSLGRHECARDVTPHRPESTPTRLAAAEEPSTFCEAAGSWAPNIKGLQSLFVKRTRKLDMLRRAIQLDDAIRSKQSLLCEE